ncbi:MAG: hypothetical protein ISN29_11000, partial [Gammaproteobacteria bacterium AqS3]|nr:hypothetical protein [Gammaproteobacteria bacterium AqS3]
NPMLQHIGVVWCTGARELTTVLRLENLGGALLSPAHLLDAHPGAECRAYFWRRPESLERLRYLPASASVLLSDAGSVRGDRITAVQRPVAELRLLRDDWALLRVDAPRSGGLVWGEFHRSLGALLGRVRAELPEFLAAGGRFALYAWSDAHSSIARSCCCRIEPLSGAIHRHDCDSGRGASGGALAAVMGRREIVIGMHLGEDPAGGERANLARIFNADWSERIRRLPPQADGYNAALHRGR